MSEDHTAPPALPKLKDALTVEAWVDSRDGRGEALQALVSQWRPPDTWAGFEAFDAADIDGLPSRGYFGAVFDGRYVYFVPEMHGESGRPTHGIVLRYDTHGDFRAAASYQAHDASRTDGLDTRGFYGGAFDGRYVYFIPRQIGMERYHSRLLRLDTHGEFRDPGSWAASDIGEEQSSQGAAFDGRYLYLCPGYSGDPKKEDQPCGKVLRYDTAGDFKSRSSYSSAEITAFLGPEAACFDGGAFDGQHVYFVPLKGGPVVRYDSRKNFTDPEAWESYDARPHGYVEAVGAVFDGTWLYFCAYCHSTVVRFDTRKPFSEAASWESFDADNTGGIRTCGFDGGFFDGRFVTFQPFVLRPESGTARYQFHSHYLRYDITKPFAEPASWQSFDASQTSGLKSVGYNAGAFDGRYFYAAPWQQGPKPGAPGEFVTHGIVLRCDTLGENGAFSLRYCEYGHNGGLTAGAGGPAFLVNTDQGCLSVTHPRLLSPGLHHLAGTYDGAEIRLYIDGELVSRREGRGDLVRSDLPVTVGQIQDGGGAFRGRVLHAAVIPAAMTPTEISAMEHAYRGNSRRQAELSIELDTYSVIDGRDRLEGIVHLAAAATEWVRLTLTHRETGALAWHQTLVGSGERWELAIPAREIPGGYYLIEAKDDCGNRCEANLVFRKERTSEKRALGPLAFAMETVDRILAAQSMRLGGMEDAPLFVTTGAPAALGYRSLGHKIGESFQTYWFPAESFDYETFRTDHELWPVLDQLSRLTGETRFSEMTDGMINALAVPGFDPASGLLYFGEESDFDVAHAGPHSKRMASDQPKFKPINGGHRTDMHIERFWERLPKQTHRWLRSTFYGLVTDARSMDFNRFCSYGYDDRERKPSQTRNSGHCGFSTAAGSLTLFWSSCWAHAGDEECLEWVRRMTAKWAEVQNARTGLIPSFFGASGWNPGGMQAPAQWAETRGATGTALHWLRSAAMLRRRPGAETLADQLETMGRRLALGVAEYAYDPARRLFREHLHFDGSPYQETARYCFRTQEEKELAMRRDPLMAQVRVYDGSGFYRNPDYYSLCAGSNVPFALGEAAALCRDPELVARLESFAADAAEEAGKLDGAFTPEGRWTFRATGWYVQLLLRLHEITGKSSYLQSARELAKREITALGGVETPHWWRLRERSVWLDALLMLEEATRSSARQPD